MGKRALYPLAAFSIVSWASRFFVYFLVFGAPFAIQSFTLASAQVTGIITVAVTALLLSSNSLRCRSWLAPLTLAVVGGMVFIAVRFLEILAVPSLYTLGIVFFVWLASGAIGYLGLRLVDHWVNGRSPRPAKF